MNSASYMSDQSIVLIDVLVDLVKHSSLELAGRVAKLLDPLAVSEAIEALLEEEIDFQVMLSFAQTCEDAQTRFNLVQGLREYAADESQENRFWLMRLLDDASLEFLYNEEVLLELQEELWVNSDSYEFESQILDISYKAEIDEVIIEELDVYRTENDIGLKGKIHVGSSLGGFDGVVTGRITKEGFEDIDATVDKSAWYGIDEPDE